MQRSDTRPKVRPPTLYNPAFEHDGCGTEFIADLRPTPFRPVAIDHRKDRPLSTLGDALVQYLRDHDSPAPVRKNGAPVAGR